MLRIASLKIQGGTIVFTLLLGSSGAVADPLDGSGMLLDWDQPFDFSTPLPSATKPAKPADASKFVPKTPQIDWSAKAGVDNRPVLPDSELRPDRFLPGTPQQPMEGVAYANVTAPGLMFMGKTSLETRLDPLQDTKLGLTMSRSVPIGSAFSVTWQNAYSMTYPLTPNATPTAALHPQGTTTAMFGTGAATVAPSGTEVFDTNQELRFAIVPVHTTFSFKATSSNTDARWLRSMSAEQKLVGGPFNITGTVQETTAGAFNKSIKAGYKKTW